MSSTARGERDQVYGDFSSQEYVVKRLNIHKSKKVEDQPAVDTPIYAV